jgi:DNA topoisomerase-1
MKTTKQKSLVIVESPAKVKTISKILGSDYIVKSSYGHIRDLPKTKFGMDPRDNFKPVYQLIKRQAKIVQELKKTSEKSKAVYLATDPDREGEAIAWHLSETLNIGQEKVWRVSFDEITSSAVRNAFKTPRKISMSLVNAQQARRLLDRIMGYKLSPLLWKKITRGLSAGRVQSVALRLLVEREKEITAFKPREYYKITVELANGKETISALLIRLNDVKIGSPLDSNSQVWLGAEPEARKLVERLLKSSFIVSSITVKEDYQYPVPPFITSTLQQMASNWLNFSPKKTMFIAQQLYEGVELPEGPTALITYMRTDSVRVSNQAIKECRDFIIANYGENLLHPEERHYKPSKQSQQAHEAIRPTYLSKTPDSIRQYLNNDQYKLYNIIWRRFVATQMKPALWHNKTVEIEATLSSGIDLSVFSNDKKKNIIAENILQSLEVWTEDLMSKGTVSQQAKELIGKIITILNKNKEDKITAMNILEELGKDPVDKALLVKVLGILDETVENNLLAERLSVQKCVFGASEHRLLFKGFLILYKPEEQLLPALKENEKLTQANITLSQLFTKPPPRYNEASLVKTLEKYGIGRPSTYAPIISTIQERGYVIKQTRQLIPTDLGTLVNDKLMPFFDDILNAQFTAQKEEELDLIEEDRKVWTETLAEFYEPFMKDLDKAEREMTNEKEDNLTSQKCQKCDSFLVERWSRFGKFLACSSYPKCKYTVSLKPRTSLPQENRMTETCEKCGKPIVVKVNRRRQRFLACTGYPECKNTKSLQKPPDAIAKEEIISEEEEV